MSSSKLIFKSDVIRLLDEYVKSHTHGKEAKTLLRAVRHDVRHRLQKEASLLWKDSCRKA